MSSKARRPKTVILNLEETDYDVTDSNSQTNANRPEDNSDLDDWSTVKIEVIKEDADSEEPNNKASSLVTTQNKDSDQIDNDPVNKPPAAILNEQITSDEQPSQSGGAEEKPSGEHVTEKKADENNETEALVETSINRLNAAQGSEKMTDAEGDSEFYITEPLEIDGDAYETVDLLVSRSAADRTTTDDEQLFNDLLFQFRRNPSLSSLPRIKLQALQELVVFPDDVKRLIKLVQTVLHVKNEFSISTCPERPLLDDLMDDHHAQAPNLDSQGQAWFRLIVFDKRTIFLSKPAPEEAQNQQTVRYLPQQSLITTDYESFGYPSPASAKSKPYQTKTLHEMCRTGFRTVVPTDVEAATSIIRFGTPIRHYIMVDGARVPGLYKFISNQYEQNCVNAEIPPRHLKFITGLEVLRIKDNADVIKKPEQKVSYESRVVSLPVLEPVASEDTDENVNLTLSAVFPGEQVLIVGLEISPQAKDLVRRNLSELSKSKQCTVFDTEQGGYILRFQPEHLKEMLIRLIPTQTAVCQNTSFEGCYNTDDVERELDIFKLKLLDLSADNVTVVRSALTHNIIDYIDSMKTIVAECKEVIQKASEKVRSTSALNYFNTSLPKITSWYKDHPFDLRTSDIEYLAELESTPDYGQVYYYHRGIAWINKDYLKEVENQSRQLAELVVKFKESRQSTDSIALLQPEAVSSLDLEQVINQNRQYTKNTYLSNIKKLLSFTQQLEEDLKEVQHGELLARLCRTLQLNNHRRKISQRSVVETVRTDSPLLVKGFSLSAFETGESDQEYSTVMSIDGKLVDLSDRPPIDLEYLSVELRDKLSGQNPFPDPSRLFTTKPLIAIGNQLVVMMNPNKLGFVMNTEDFLKAVYDISEISDELDDERFYRNSYVRDRVTPQTTKAELDQLRADARQSFKDDIGSDVEVKTNRRCAIILARLLVELETHRPKYPFRRLFALSGRKSIGRDEDTKYETYTEDNKVNYIVQVASRPADLGEKGRLMQNTQADNLKNVGNWMALYYDRFKDKPDISAGYLSAAEADTKQDIIKTEARREGQAKGFDLLLFDSKSVEDDKAKSLINKLSQHEHDLNTFVDGLSRTQEDYAELNSIKSGLRLNIRFLTFVVLRDIQRIIENSVPEEQLFEAVSNYNPDQYGEEKGSAVCKPENVCILNTSADIKKAVLETLIKVKRVEEVYLKIRRILPKFTLGRRHQLITYLPELLKQVVTDKQSKFTVSGSVDFTTHGRKPAARLSRQDVLTNIDKLCKLISRLASKPPEWSGSFSVALSSSLGKLERVYQDQEARSRFATAEAVKHARPIQKYLTSVLLLKQFNLALRKHICLLRNGLAIRINNYSLTTRQDTDDGLGYIAADQYDATISLRRLFKDKLAPSDVMYWNRKSDTYLDKYRDLQGKLSQHSFVHDVTDITRVEASDLGITSAVASEILLNILVDELVHVLKFVAVCEEDSFSILMACEFCEEFVNWCLSQQHEQDKTLYDAHVALSRRQEIEAIRLSQLTKQQRDELYMRQRAGLVVSYLDDEFGDDRDRDQQGDDSPYKREDGYDLDDDENRANLSMGDDY